MGGLPWSELESMAGHGELTGEGTQLGGGMRRGRAAGGAPWGLSPAAHLVRSVRAAVHEKQKQEGEEEEEREKKKKRKEKKRKKYGKFFKLENFGE
jgi:hypothetical protein